MKYLKNAFDLYINSSIHVSLAVVAFTLITYLQTGLVADKDLLLFIFFASVTGYNFVKYAGIAKLHHLSLANNLRFIQLFSFLCFVALVYYSFQLETRILITAGILGIFTLLYAIPILGENKNLRSLPGLKIFVISIVWAGSTVLLPIIHNGVFISLQFIVDFIQRFMLVIVLTLPFEIRDVDYDNEDLGTIPQKLGIFKTKIFGFILILLIFSAEILQNQIRSDEFLPLVIILAVSGFFLWKAKRKQTKYYSSFWVEAVPLFYLCIYWIFMHYPVHILF